MNATWHERNKLARNATLEQRIEWHREHQRECACRPVPESLRSHLRPARKKQS